MFDLDQFIADLRATLPERSRQAMREVVARAVADPEALAAALGRQDQMVQVLHRAPDMTVLNIIWPPKFVTAPHNHLMTAVIGMYEGREDNVFWRRQPETDRHQIAPAGGQALAQGDVALLGPDIIHSVVNPLSRQSRAIHVYDGDFFTAERSMWDPETLAEERYDVEKMRRQ
jgi:hypothetical protein